jgi:ATP-binding protein involved in chromosome partitioning
MNIDKIYEVLKDIIPREKISGLEIDSDGVVMFSILVDPALGTQMEDLRQKAEKIVLGIEGIKKAIIILTAEKPAQPVANDPHGMSKNPKLKLPIKKIIAVASGKGGVGKSTVAFNVAGQLAKMGLSVGLLDADIYGPSVPKLAGLSYEKPEMTADRQIIPFKAHGMKVMSIGFMVDQDTPMIWRGPMVQSAIYQMLRDVEWSSEEDPLDILVIDMPPGTGDAQLTVAQKIDVDGAIIVSTPQDLALMDAIKAIEMFKKTDVPILGLIENMSTHICTNCGHEEHIFGHGEVAKESKKRSVSYLGEIPLDISVRVNSDSGKMSDLNAYKSIAKLVFDTL